MTVPSLLIDLAVAVVAFVPPTVSDSRSVLQRVADAGVIVRGRDPSAGSGLCVALLPVHVPSDVHYVTLPPKFTASDLWLLRRLPNLEQIRCERMVTSEEFEMVRRAAGPRTWILCKVQSNEGSGRFWIRRPIYDTDGNLIGDTLVDENDVPLPEG